MIVVSLGAALVVTEKMAKRVSAPAVKRVSTVGAGDCMVAGMVYQLSLEQDVTTAVQFGVACGTAATLNPGTALCDKEDAHWLYDIIRSQ